MLDEASMQRLVDMQQRSYQLLRWVSQAVKSGFIRFDTAHQYTNLPEATEPWMVEHYDNLPIDARPDKQDLAAFSRFFSTYLSNSFDLVEKPGKQLYSPGSHCFCPMCSWFVESPHLKTKKVDSRAKRRAQTMRLNVMAGVAAEYQRSIPDSVFETSLKQRETFVDASLVAYGVDLTERELGIANGPAVLALWRGFAWNELGSPKPRFQLSAAAILNAQSRLLEVVLQRPPTSLR